MIATRGSSVCHPSAGHMRRIEELVEMDSVIGDPAVVQHRDGGIDHAGRAA